MMVLALATLYLLCSALLIAVVWQDRRRAVGRRDPRDPRSTQVKEFVFRTQA